MVGREDGFHYPRVDAARCSSCLVCTRACPVLRGVDLTDAAQPKAFWAQHANADVRVKSTSGGAFSALAEWVIAREGMVVAAGYDANMRVVHQCITALSDVARLRGSKYVQSELSRDIFLKIRDALKCNRWILFVGTPCQAAAVRLFVGRHEQLLLCDVICMGVPAPGFWLRYIAWLRDAWGVKAIANYQFRNKRRGWSRPTLCMNSNEGRTRFVRPEDDPYSLAFYGHLGLRESCYQCLFKGERRVSDLTLADFWGAEKIQPAVPGQSKGVSLVLCHTAQGRNVLTSLMPAALSLREVPLEVAVNGNPMMVRSICRPLGRNEFCRDSLAMPFVSLMTKYHLGRVSFARKMVRTVRKTVKRILASLAR